MGIWVQEFGILKNCSRKTSWDLIHWEDLWKSLLQRCKWGKLEAVLSLGLTSCLLSASWLCFSNLLSCNCKSKKSFLPQVTSCLVLAIPVTNVANAQAEQMRSRESSWRPSKRNRMSNTQLLVMKQQRKNPGLCCGLYKNGHMGSYVRMLDH